MASTERILRWSWGLVALFGGSGVLLLLNLDGLNALFAELFLGLLFVAGLAVFLRLRVGIYLIGLAGLFALQYGIGRMFVYGVTNLLALLLVAVGVALFYNGYKVYQSDIGSKGETIPQNPP